VLVALAAVLSCVAGDGDFDCFVINLAGNIKDYRQTFVIGTGTNALPSLTEYTYASNTQSTPWFGINMGNGASIECVDLDGDYDFDCLMGTTSGTIVYYYNSGSPKTPAFTLDSATNPFSTFAGTGSTTIRCVDLDDDGDLDCILGLSTGALAYYLNTGSSTSAVFTLQSGAADDPFDGFATAGTNAAIAFADFDNDQDLDLVVGDSGGLIQYYKNTGTRTAPVFALQSGASDPFDGVSLGDSNASPWCGDYDRDEDVDCFFGADTGYIKYVKNEGTATAATMLLTTTLNPFDTIDVGSNSALTCMDIDANCNIHASCSGRGICYGTRQCACYEGFGGATDITPHKDASCGTRTCPAGRAWIDIPTAATIAHALAECSNQGICERASGSCKCFNGFTGEACQRMKCPSASMDLDVECSGHGRCVSMKRMAEITSAMPLSAATTYTGSEDTTTWDEEKTYGCVCDSSWTVGLGSGETQQSEYFGPDCGLKRCPTGADPVTAAQGGDTTNCGGVVAEGGFGTGSYNNRCHVDCSNRGLCDFETGTCECFAGFYGDNCGTVNGLATED